MRQMIVRGIRRCGPLCWPWIASFPKIGKYALAQILANERYPRRAALPALVELLPGLSQGRPEALALADFLLADMPRAPFDIWPYAIVQASRGTEFRGRKVAVIAHWDQDGIIDPYVLHYAEALCKLGYRVVLASDMPVGLQPGRPITTPEELPQAFDAIVHRTCPGYDFTSWKAVLCALPEIFSASELLLTNDSIFAPIFDLRPMHDVMNALACDFWGLVESQDRKPHLQSYYLVFSPVALTSLAFAQYWDLVGPQNDKQKAISYELNLSLWLARHGLRPGAYSPKENQPAPMLNPTHCNWEFLLEQCHAPFVKRDLIFQNPYLVSLEHMEGVLKSHGYPVDLILAYGARTGQVPYFSGKRPGH